MFGTVHWDFGRRLIERLPRGDDRTRIAQAYYRAVGGVLQLWAEHAELRVHLDAGVRLLRDDPVLLMYEGTIHQAYAEPRTQQYFDERRRELEEQAAALPINTGARAVQPRRMTPELPPTAAESRSRAERAVRRAVSADPDLHEARLRLAHVLHDRGRDDDAWRQIELVTSVAALPPFVDDYAAVLAGRVSRAQTRLDDARRWFERAQLLQPDAQIPHVALSELALAKGDRAAAGALLAALPVAGDVTDLWWHTGRMHGTSAQQLVDAMRSAFR
jgi:hypothetical protein